MSSVRTDGDEDDAEAKIHILTHKITVDVKIDQLINNLHSRKAKERICRKY